MALLISAMPLIALADEPIEIVYFRPELSRNAVAYYSDTAWVKELESRLNIKLTFKGSPTNDEYYTVANAMLISGEYPDLLYYDWSQYPGGALAAVEDGVIVPISEIPEYKEKVPNWFSVIEQNDGARRAVTQDDGSIITFCHWEPDMARSAYWGYAIRKDWLDRLGLEVPTIIDELYTVLKAFKEQDANGNGDPNDEIPFTSCNWWLTVHPGMDTLAAAFSMKVNNMYRNPQTGEVTYWTEYNDGANFKSYVETMRNWYAEGLIDEEFVSQKYDACAAKITGDRAGMFFCFPDNVGSYEASIKQTMLDRSYGNPDDIMIYGMVPMKGIDGVPYNYDADNAMVSYAGAVQATVITTAAIERGTIDKCLELINYLYSEEDSELINRGVEGVSHTKNADGTHAWTDKVTADPDYGMADAVFKYALPTMGGWPKAMSYEAWGSMNLVVPDQIITHKNYAKGDTSLDLPSFVLNTEEQEAYNLVFTEVNTAVSEVYLSVITGAKPLEELDKLLAQVKAMGIQQAIDAYQSAYSRYLAR